MKLLKTPASKRPDLSIIIPAYCEERRIGRTLDDLAAFLKGNAFFKQQDVEVLVVATNAPDKTHEIINAKQALFKRFVFLKPGPLVGKGRDVQFGMLRAAGKVAVFMDADLATPLHHLQSFYEACVDGNDVVVGTRNLLTYRPGLARGVFAYAGNALYRIAGGVSVSDTQCGFKMFNERARTYCFSKLTILGWGFDLEVFAIARANKLSVKTFRIEDYKHMPFSTHKESVIDITIRMVKDFSRVRRNSRDGKYVIS